MKSLDGLDPVAWARKVNGSWIVHNDLNRSAEEWLRHLEDLNDGRLLRSCQLARGMCRARDPLDDPKPWFYSGLFHLATADEARRFLHLHRVTRSTVPAMADDEAVRLWLERIPPETKVLLDRMREAVGNIEG